MANTGPKRNKIQRQSDCEAVARLTLQGWTQSDIAQFLELDQSTISRDLKIIQKQWKESSVRDFDLDRQQELKRLAMLEREYWAAWERSQQARESNSLEKFVTGKDDAGTTLGRVKQATRSQQQVGDAVFLNGIQRVIDARCKLLGLYPTERDSTSEVQLNPNQLSVISSLMRESQQINDSSN